MATTSVSYGVRERRWGTLRLLRVFRSSLLGLDLLLLLLVLGVAQLDHETARQISNELAPAAAAAAQLQTGLPRMDADLAGELAVHGAAREAMEARYASERGLAVHALVQQAGAAAETRGSVESLETGLQHYEQRAQQARDGAPEAASEAVSQAASVLRTELAPAAQRLADADDRALDRSFAIQRRRDRMLQTALAILLAGVLLTLVWAQISLALRTHRVLNVALLAATVCVAAFGLHLGSRIGQEIHVLDAGAEAQLPELRALWRSERLAASVQDLLAQPGAAAGPRVRELAREIARRPGALSEDETEAALREGGVVPGLRGALPEAAEAAPGPEQRELALAALRQWRVYAAGAGLDSGAKKGAVARDPDDLQPFTAALDGAAERSMTRLHGALREAMEQPGGVALEALLAAALEGVLVVWGFAARLREYR